MDDESDTQFDGEEDVEHLRKSKRTKRNRNGATKPAAIEEEFEDEPTQQEVQRLDLSKLPEGAVLAKDQLLVLSSEDFDLYVSHIQSQRPLSSDEKSDFKGIRRRIRNRESARESRSNKKGYETTLQARVETLTGHNRQLGLQVSSLQSENSTLKEEVTYLQDMIKKTPALESLFNAIVMISTQQRMTQNVSPGDLAAASFVADGSPDATNNHNIL